jgi:hypothetical protein
MDACTRALGLEEVRTEIITMLDARSLRSAMHVSRSWARTAVRQLWRSQDVPSRALRTVRPSRRHVYAPAIRSLALYSPKAAQRDARHWDFPGIRRLSVHPQLAGAVRRFEVTLGRCGAVLDAVAFAFRAELPAIAAGGYGGISRANNEHLPADERAGRQTHTMHPNVLCALARLPRLRALHANALVTGSGVQQLLHAGMPSPFATLTKYHSWVLLADWPALVDMLAQASSLTDLTLIVDRWRSGLDPLTPVAEHALRNAALLATAQRLPRQLQRLELVFHPALVANENSAADVQLVSDDFAVLAELGALTALVIRGGYVRVNTDAAWRRFLGRLPRLQRLGLGATCRLPPAALVALGECCRELRELSLNMWSAVVVAIDHIPAVRSFSAVATAEKPERVLFPQLRRLCFEQPIVFEELTDIYHGDYAQ